MWNSHRPRWPRSSFSQPNIDQNSHDQTSVNQPSTKDLEIKFQWTIHRRRPSNSSLQWKINRLRRSRSSFIEAAIDQDGQDQVSVNHTSTKTVEIKFQWISQQQRWLTSSFSEPAINQNGRDQVSENQGWDKVKYAAADYQDGQVHISVNQSATKVVEIKFQWTSHRPRWPRSSCSEPVINKGGWDQVSDKMKCAAAD